MAPTRPSSFRVSRRNRCSRFVWRRVCCRLSQSRAPPFLWLRLRHCPSAGPGRRTIRGKLQAAGPARRLRGLRRADAGAATPPPDPQIHPRSRSLPQDAATRTRCWCPAAEPSCGPAFSKSNGDAPFSFLPPAAFQSDRTLYRNEPP